MLIWNATFPSVKEILCENLSENSLISQRHVNDYVVDAGGDSQNRYLKKHDTCCMEYILKGVWGFELFGGIQTRA